MPLYNPTTVMPEPINSGGAWQQPDLGGDAYAQMAKSITGSMNKTSENIGSIMQQRAGASALLNQMAGAKIPGTNQNMFDPEMMTKLAKGPLAAQQQFLGTAMATYAQAQQENVAQTQQMQLLKMLSQPQNQGLLRTKMYMSGTNPGNIPAPGTMNTPVAAPVPTSDPQNPTKSQTKDAPFFAAPPGMHWNKHDVNGSTIHALHDNTTGAVVSGYNPDGSIVGPGGASVRPTIGGS